MRVSPFLNWRSSGMLPQNGYRGIVSGDVPARVAVYYADSKISPITTSQSVGTVALFINFGFSAIDTRYSQQKVRFLSSNSFSFICVTLSTTNGPSAYLIKLAAEMPVAWNQSQLQSISTPVSLTTIYIYKLS